MDKLISIFESDYILFMDVKQHVMIACNALQAQIIGNNDVYLHNNLDITQAPLFIFEFKSATITTSDNNLANYSNEAINILGSFYRREKLLMINNL
ncbi:hypothetical protein C2G38_2194461 [Gigaspora rosea]|uniref:Uncharacterized protein n=1 Tax=Gigaspora rosea TaxID=44941 RepID=A0A397V0X9_9GLOM|nr:hypothetical protein C2G38_2194461 [Gigaspora rosea]